MGRRWVIVMALSGLLACESDDTPMDAGDSSTDGAVDSSIDGSDSSLPDGGLPDDERPATLSPLACQTDLTVLREDDFERRRHPLEHKGQIFGLRDIGPELALIELASETVLAVTDQMVSGFDDQTLLFPIGSTEISVAPDFGLDSSPDYPVVFNAIMSGTGAVLFRSDAEGGLATVVANTQMINLGDGLAGPLSGFTQVRMGADGTVFFLVQLDGSRERHLVQQRGPGSGIQALIRTGMTLDDTHQVATIESYDIQDGPIVRVGLRTAVDGPQIGFAYVRPTTGGVQCLATDTEMTCGGLRIAEGALANLEDFGSDGVSTGVVFRDDPSSPSLHFQAGGTPAEMVIERGVETQGFSFNNFKLPRACGRDGSLYFVGQLDADTPTPHDELMRVDRQGTLTQLTDFGSLVGVEALVGEVPDRIDGLALGYGCDAILRTRGIPFEDSTSPYEGYWVSYFGGDTIEIIDETPGRDGNGNGTVTEIDSRSRSGIDPNASWNTPTNVGPDGEFTMLVQRSSGVRSTYARATQPRDRCRAPNVVNSDGDADDAVPGDGRCDTGAMAGSDPECTLRAVIQETNANPGSDLGRVDGPRTIRLESPLPAITSALVFEGDATVIDGSALSGEVVGLDVQIRGVELNGLRLQGFPSHGIRASEYVQLDDVWSSSNCGWGAWLEAGASIEGAPEDAARFENNGAGDDCAAGGIFQAGLDVQIRLSYVQANTNDGPGIASVGPINTTFLEASDNEGDGVVVDLDGSTNDALYALFGTITASGNRGHGLALRGGGVLTRVANVVLERNCGFGLWVEDANALLFTRFGRMPGFRHVMSDNGRTPIAGGGGRFFEFGMGAALESVSRTCGGGGISIIGLEAEGDTTRSRIDSVDIEENQGPGIASNAEWLLGDAVIRSNFGPGILIAADPADDEPGTAATVVSFPSGRSQSVVSDNLSHGIEIGSGAFVVGSDLLMENNVGSGVRLYDGNAQLNLMLAGTNTTIRRSGRAMLDCQVWTYGDGEWLREEAPCDQIGGIVTDLGDISAVGPIVRDNAGPGLSAADPDDEDLGVITITGGEVCGNDAPDVAREMNYTGVTTDCE